MTRNQKNKERNKRKKKELKEARLLRWETCCKDSLVEWDCYCSYGCNSCDYHSKCSKCGTLYKQLAVIVKKKSE